MIPEFHSYKGDNGDNGGSQENPPSEPEEPTRIPGDVLEPEDVLKAGQEADQVTV